MSLGLIDTPHQRVLYCPVRVKTQGKRTCTGGSLESVPIVQRIHRIELVLVRSVIHDSALHQLPWSLQVARVSPVRRPSR